MMKGSVRKRRAALFVGVTFGLLPSAAFAQSVSATPEQPRASTVGVPDQSKPGSAAAQPDAATAPTTDGTAAVQGPQQTNGVEDIVVTAQRREQNLQKVPISITALSQNAILANRIQDVRDLSGLVPNLTVRPSSGGSLLPNYTLRGIFTGGSALGTDKGVALYIDGVYIQSVVGSIFELADIERIEVLKGPQGTLFGRNATGGAVSLITHNPTGELGITQDVSYGNYNQLRVRTHVDLPKIGPLSLSGTYLHSERRGDVRNLGAGTKWDYGPATGGRIGVQTSPDYLGNSNVEGFVGAAKLDLDANLDLVYKFDYTENHYTADASGVGYLPSTSFLMPLYNAQNPALRTPVTTQRPDAVNNAYTTPSFSRSSGHNLTARYRFNDQISVKNILSFRRSYTISDQEGDGLGGLVNNPVPLAPGFSVPPAWINGGNPGAACLVAVPSASCLQSIGKPFTYVAYNSVTELRQWSDEFQVNIKTDGFNLTAGYLHFFDHQLAGSPSNIRNVSLLTAFYGQNTSAQGTAFVIPGNGNYQPGQVDVTSDAWYIQPEIHLTSKLDLIGGGRITKDRKVGFEPFPNQVPAVGNVPISYRDSEFTYLVGVNYQAFENVLTYVKYATGYISGGQLATVPFAPERARSLEGGIKADLFNRRFRSNLAVFRVNYDSIQYSTGGSVSGVPAALQFGTVVVPSANALAYGAEWENTIVPINGLTLGVNVGYLHFKFDQNTVFGGPGCAGPTCTSGFIFQDGAAAYQEFGRPKWTGNLSAQYETGEVFDGAHLMFRTDANYTSKTLLTSDITPGTGPTAQVDPALVNAATSPAHFIVNGRVALTDFRIGRTTGTVAIWGRNIFDRKDITQYVGLGPLASVLYERARTFGADLSIRFK